MLKKLSKWARVIFAVFVVSALISIIGAPFVIDATRSLGRWEATKDLLSVDQAPRLTDQPGVMAWLQGLLRKRCESEPNADAAGQCTQLVFRSDNIPSRLNGALGKYLTPLPPGAVKDTIPKVPDLKEPPQPTGRLCISEYRVGTNHYVATTPFLKGDCKANSDADFIKWAIAELELRKEPESVPLAPFGEASTLRAFILRQNGTIVSRRFTDDHLPDSQPGLEYQQFMSRAKLTGTPAIGTVGTFFPRARSDAASYTGAYVDVTDLGVIATGLRVVKFGPEEAVLAVDVALGTDWMSNIKSDRPKLAPLPLGGQGTWTQVADYAREHAIDDLAAMAASCADPARPFDSVNTCNSTSNAGTLTAVLVAGKRPDDPAAKIDNARWLIAWMPRERTPHSVGTVFPGVMLLLGAFAFLAIESEHHKSKAEVKQALSRKEAETEVWKSWAEKHGAEAQQRAVELAAASEDLAAREMSLTNWRHWADSLDNGLVTIDPNTDRVRYRNGKAAALGIAVDQPFRELVSEEDRKSYDEYNTVTGDSQRAYIVRMDFHVGKSVWAVIRSNTFAKSMPDLKARESDRIGIVTVLSDHEAQRVFASVESKAVREERAKLASLLAHGATAIAHLIPGEQEPATREILNEFLSHRIDVLASIMADWAVPLKALRGDEVAVPKETVEGFLRRFRALAERVAQDRDLREKIEWGNGVLSALKKGSDAFYMDLSEWSQDLELTTLISGAELFIFEELLVNAFKYGKPGTTPWLTAKVSLHPERRWIQFTLRNEVQSPHDVALVDNSTRYGGHVLVAETCRRLHWELDPPVLEGNQFEIVWRARCIESTGGRAK